MPGTEPTVELNEGFSEPGAAARPWAEVADVLSKSEMFWLSTVRRDGRPHVTPLPAIWLDGTLHFCAGSHEQKAKNLESNPRCILTTGTSHLRSGLDVVVEGTAARVTDTAQLQRLAAMWKSKLECHLHRVAATGLPRRSVFAQEAISNSVLKIRYLTGAESSALTKNRNWVPGRLAMFKIKKVAVTFCTVTLGHRR
jgi:general stress protein 26